MRRHPLSQQELAGRIEKRQDAMNALHTTEPGPLLDSTARNSVPKAAVSAIASVCGIALASADVAGAGNPSRGLT